MAKKKTGTSRRPRSKTVQDAAVDANAEVQSAADQVAAAREQLRDAEVLLERVREKAVERVDWVRDKNAGELIDTTLDFVRKHPGLGVLTAASVGYLFARLFRR